MRYIPLFILIQLVNLILMPIGWIVCLWPALARASWIFWNSIDPPTGSWAYQYYWLAWRNPVSNLRLVPGVSGTNRPLWYWTNAKQTLYAKADGLSNTYPVLSAGSGRGY